MMQRHIRFPFLFLFIAACIGLLLRWHFISPIAWIKFPYWLHAHSHIMFLGWIFNLLTIAFIHEYIPECKRKKYLTLFLIIQVMLLGMLISFPMQGYGLYSIAISTVHTFAIGIFSIWFFKDTKDCKNVPSYRFARLSLVFFLVSAVGPFTLGPLMANGLAQTKWYYFAVYYYLHFQYNGVFTFGAISLFFSLINTKGVLVDHSLSRRFSILMVISCMMTYTLSILWAQPGLTFNVIGLIAALIQIIAFIYFIRLIKSFPANLFKSISSSARVLFVIAFLSLTIKIMLQLLSAHPYVAQLAYEFRNFVMAYLHLVLLGMISGFLIGWCIEKSWIRKEALRSLLFFLVGFSGMEMVLVLSKSFQPVNVAYLLFIFSLLLVIGIAGFMFNSFQSDIVSD